MTEEIPVRATDDPTAPEARLDEAIKQITLAREDDRAAAIERRLGDVLADLRECREVVEREDRGKIADGGTTHADGQQASLGAWCVECGVSVARDGDRDAPNNCPECRVLRWADGGFQEGHR